MDVPEGVADHITRDAELRDLVGKIAGDGALPDVFQVLFEVLVRPQLESAVLRVRVLKTWPLPV
jgi:hypothetical protein